MTKQKKQLPKLITLCPTCHSIAHIEGNKSNPLTINEIQKVLLKYCKRPNYKYTKSGKASRYHLEQYMSSAQIAKAKKLAREFVTVKE